MDELLTLGCIVLFFALVVVLASRSWHSDAVRLYVLS